MRRRGFLLGAAALLLRVAALGDDAPMSLYGGSARVMDESRVPISMDSETVLISLRRDDYEVRVTFRFFNHGASTTVPVGFPVVAPTGFRGGPDPITDFATWTDGVRREVRELGSSPEDGARYAPPGALGAVSAVPQALRWLVADLPFPAGKETTVRVRYRGAYDPDPPWDRGAQYLFGTGAAWKGPIGSALFVVDRGSMTDAPAVRFVHAGAARPRTVRLGRDTTAYRFSGIEPPPSAALEVSFPGEEREGAAPRDADGDERPRVARYEDWRFAREPVRDEDLEPLTTAELRIFRNFFFAGHGRVFADPELQDLFRSYAWYRPRSDFRPSDLSPLEAANVGRIERFEKLSPPGAPPDGPFDLGDLRFPVGSARRLLDALNRRDVAAVRAELASIETRPDGAYLIPAEAVVAAVESGQTEALKLLLDKGADADQLGQAALRAAACGGRDDALDLLLTPERMIGAGAFDFACDGGSRRARARKRASPPAEPSGAWLKVLRRFAAEPRAMNREGAAVLTKAARSGWTSAVDLLLRAGVADDGGALEAAAHAGFLPVVRLLTEPGRQGQAALNAALLDAVLDEHADVAATLIDRGADVNTEDGLRRTPLIVAAWSDDPALVGLMLDKGAAISAKNGDGRTALQEAESRRCENAAALLRARAASGAPAGLPVPLK